MAALTKTQLEHAKSRIETAMAAYIHRNMAVLGEEPDVVEFDEEQKVAMIRSGVAVLDSNVDRYRCGLTAYFSYPDTPEMAAARTKRKVWRDTAGAINKGASEKKEQLLDELVMSPDGAAALARIAAAFA